MNSKQELVIRLAKTGHNVFVTGHIGTGKTSVVRTVIQQLREQGKQVAVTASTGLASKQIKGTLKIYL
jgi:ATP-dependent DNA helicase PIF1